ncbi:4-hydroxy-tetrahydrodipicolinate reductase [uncultured Limosilactobacillus sp.]|uniref:4-hydroxy-tetrahydrodipicolinate reductase n=1 Tax=uncultured Limosilactobacillus sp. TaxID=2837629 RepID=UPI0025D61C7F|nr:4-hydroxy-tetrahydrodipicolinate reductase [uncultured Limosilactobacillus sp.]
MTRVLVAGFTGSMGRQVVDLVRSLDGFEISAVLDPSAKLEDLTAEGLSIHTTLYHDAVEIDGPVADVWVDFTVPAAVFANAQAAINNGIVPIIGTTGLNDQQVASLKELAAQKGVGGLIAPNFGMSAVLLMKFAQEAAAYFPDVEIIEMHHADKADSPSGTALATAKMIDENRPEHESSPDKVSTLAHARGGDYHGIHIHSVRLPGYVAHEQVLFGGAGEALTIRQDSFDRHSFMSGVKVSLQKYQQLDQLVVGLENIL